MKQFIVMLLKIFWFWMLFYMPILNCRIIIFQCQELKIKHSSCIWLNCVEIFLFLFFNLLSSFFFFFPISKSSRITFAAFEGVYFLFELEHTNYCIQRCLFQIYLAKWTMLVKFSTLQTKFLYTCCFCVICV